MKTPLILITNDDGIQAPGIAYLIECVRDMGNIIVMAPTEGQSGKSSAITCDNTISLVNYPSKYKNVEMIGVTGTPTDCVKLCLHIQRNNRPTLILSGINHGSNSSFNVIYSGTMGATIEGCMAGIPSIGFSLLDHSMDADFTVCGGVIRQIVGEVIKKGLPKDVCLNVNIPTGFEPKGIKVVKSAYGHWTEEYTAITNDDGSMSYKLSGRFVEDNPDDEDGDNYWLRNKYATVVPIRPDQTDSTAIPIIKDIIGIK